MKLFNTNDTEQVIYFLDQIIKRNIPKGDRPCFCHNGLLYNKCHKKAVSYIRQLKAEKIIVIRDELLSYSYPGSDLKTQT